MRISPAPFSAAAPPQPRLAVRVPIAMAYPAPAVPGETRITERSKASRGLRLCQRDFYFLAQLRRDLFIRVQIKDPVAGSFGSGGTFLGDHPFPWFAENSCAIFQREIIGSVANLFV